MNYFPLEDPLPGDSPTARALHADAEAARAEIRAAGICCPSCGVNMADLPPGHMLELGVEGGDAKCADGSVADFDAMPPGAFAAAVNVNLMDQYRAAEEQITAQMLGSGWSGPS